jgi:hypothetical protein
VTGDPDTTAPGTASPTSITEISPGDPSVWQPKSFPEWEAREKAKTFLTAWTDQMVHERALRSLAAKVIFGLIGAQVLGVFGVVTFQGLGFLVIDVKVLQVLIPSVLADVFGLGFLVTKYLFSQPLRHGLDALVKEKASGDAA